MKHVQKGFTLLELMIVVAIISILSAVAISAYQDYTIKSANRGCMIETKAYTNAVLAAVGDGIAPDVPIVGACDSITDASTWTAATLADITGDPKDPGDTNTVCNTLSGGACTGP